MNPKPGRPGPPAPPNAAASLLASAVTHHQAGRLEQAQALYRQILASSPRHADAMHLLGVTELQAGALDRAAQLIQQAIEIDPKMAAAYSNLGTVHLRAGRLELARIALDRALKLQPGNVQAQLNLGTVLHALGQHAAAVTALRRAAAADPKSASTHNLLGAALLGAADAAAAVRAFETVVRLQPADAEAWTNLAIARLQNGDALGSLQGSDKALALLPRHANALSNRGSALVALGRLEEARQDFERALALEPGSAQAHANLGIWNLDHGEPGAALEALRRAVELAPQLSAAQSSLVLALRKAGREDDALVLAKRLAADHPGAAEPTAALAALLFERGDLDGAIAQYSLAATLPGTSAGTWLAFANALMAQGRASEAVQKYKQAVSTDPSHAAARWALAMASVRPIYDGSQEIEPSRQRFAKALADLDRWFDTARERQGHLAVGSTQPFYLAYQPFDNRALLTSYGRLCARLMARSPFAREAASAAPPVGRRLRVGIASSHVRDHSVWNAITRGWIRHIDRSRFEIQVFHLGRGGDAETGRTRASVDRFVDASGGIAAASAAIAGSALDVLIYPEIGMDTLTTRLAALRLAPVQAASWGHPETTGLPTIDLYLSAEFLEPEMAQAHYSEKLVCLPNLGVCYEPLDTPATAPDLFALGLPGNEPLLLCPGAPFKYSPLHDTVWVDIARQIPRGRLVFFRSQHEAMNRSLNERLRRAFDKAQVDFDARVAFIPTLDRSRFFGLMQRSALFLDTLGFSGFNTAMQAMQCGLPIIAREGEFMRGRLASGILRRAGLDACVATTDQAYVDIAVRLAQDDGARLSLRSEIGSRRSLLLNDLAPVRALEDALIQARRDAG